jgi:two-component system chemotaxis response regulator CheY
MKLRAAGFEVTKAKESSEAITALGEYPTDAVLMDIDFPADVCNGGMGSWDGFQLMSWLRSLPTPKKPRFIMVSSSDSPANRQRAEKGGAVAYFQKPLDYEQLLAAVNA